MWHMDKPQCQDGHSEAVPPSENLVMDGKTSEVGIYVASKCNRVCICQCLASGWQISFCTTMECNIAKVKLYCNS